MHCMLTPSKICAVKTNTAPMLLSLQKYVRKRNWEFVIAIRLTLWQVLQTYQPLTRQAQFQIPHYQFHNYVVSPHEPQKFSGG